MRSVRSPGPESQPGAVETVVTANRSYRGMPQDRATCQTGLGKIHMLETEIRVAQESGIHESKRESPCVDAAQRRAQVVESTPKQREKQGNQRRVRTNLDTFKVDLEEAHRHRPSFRVRGPGNMT